MKTSILFIAGAFCSIGVQAQEADSTLNQSVTIERAYLPVFKEANKIDRQPAIEEIKVNHTPATYAETNSPNVRPDEIHDMRVGQVVATPSPTQEGFLSFSAGNYWNTDIQAGYRKGEFSFGADGYLTSASLKTPYLRCDGSVVLPTYAYSADDLNSLYSKGTWNSMLCRGNLNAGYNHTFDNMHRINANASFGGSFCNIMNYDNFLIPYFDEEGNTQMLLMQSKTKSSLQHWGHLLFDAQYEARNFDVKFAFEHVGVKHPDLYENTLSILANILAYRQDEWLVTAALNSSLIFGKEKNHFTIRPEVELSYMPDSYNWRRAYVNIGIGSHRESLNELMNRMPLTYYTDYDNAFDAFNLTLGWEDSDKGWLKYGASVNMNIVRNDLSGVMCSNGLFSNEMIDSTQIVLHQQALATSGLGGTYAMLATDDCVHFQLEAHLDYEYNRFFSAKAQVLWYPDNCKLSGMGEPEFVTNLHLLGNIRKVKMDLSFQGGFKREMEIFTNSIFGQPYYDGDLQTIDLGNVADLGFRLDYQYKSNLNLYAFAGNILNRKYQYWTTIPSQGINIHAGFKWEF